MEKTERIIGAIRLACLFIIVLSFWGATTVQAETSVGGAIHENTAWVADQSPYLVTTDILVDSGATLTVAAGVTVRFQAGRQLTVLNGALRVTGTALAPVVFTSARDVVAGSPAAGDWAGMQFLDNTNDSATILDNLSVSYGSTTSLTASSPTFNNCRFEYNSGHALAIDLNSFPHGTGNSATGNGIDAIRVPAGEMLASGAWDLTDIPYFLEGVVSVGAAPTVTGLTPASVEQGSTVAVVISGTRLTGAKRVTFPDAGITASIQPGGTATSLPVLLTLASTVPLGPSGFSVTVAAGDASLPIGITVVPPIPMVTSVTPNRIYLNRPDTTIDIAGQNFVAETTAFLDGVSLATTYVSPTLVRAIVPLKSLAVVGQMQVRNPDPRLAGSYIVSNNTPFTVELPQFVFSPTSLSLRQAETSTVLTLNIPFVAPAGGITANLTSTNPSAATVPATVTIPDGATSVAVSITAPDTANSHDVTLEVHGNQNNWIGNKSTVTVRPEPTVNLSPATLLTGQGFTFFLSANLTDPAPAGGLVITLAAAPANIVTLPASVTVPEGATQAQVTVANTGTGTAVITGTPAAGKGFTVGDTSTVTVKPIQTTSVTPLVSPLVGVRVVTALPSNSKDATYAPLISRPVGIAYGSMVTGMTPNRAPFGTQNLLVRVNGSGFLSDSSVAISPALSGVTLRNDPLVVAPDGSYVEFPVDIAADAQVGDRIVTVTSNGKTVPAGTADLNRFKVTWPAPELWSLATNSAVVNTTITLQLSGRYFQGATSVAFEPSQGILVGTPISISTDGTTVTVPVYVVPDAAPGKRAVRIATPGGSTGSAQQTGNVFTVLAVPGDTYTSVVSRRVGVQVQTPTPPNSQEVTYSPLASRIVGVSLGSVITGVEPASGAIGTTDLRFRVNGNGLTGVDSFTIEPNTGLTITRPEPPVAPDGSWAEALVSIAADAPLTPRVVILKKGTAVIPAASADGNRFRVTLPMPEMVSIFPNRREVGSSFTFTVNGRLLTGATAISFSPPDGINVDALSVSSDGTIATATVIIAANATLGQRVVTITTPGGTTSLTPTINTFTVTATAGSTYSSLISLPVGVNVSTTALPADHLVNYGPIVSGAVGVSLPVPSPSTTHDVTYGPTVSRSVGITVGPVVIGMTPAAIEPGTTKTLTFAGTGLGAVTSLLISPDTGLTFGVLAPSPDGTALTVDVTADATAPRAPRVAVLKTAAGPVPTPWAGSNLLYVGAKPAITSLAPSLQTVGTTFTLTVEGNNLNGATVVRFEPPDGIAVVSPLSINAGGTIATVTVLVDGNAAGGQRLVVIDGPYGSSGNVSGANNTFTVYRPVVTAPAPVRNIARTNPEKHDAFPVAGSSGSSSILALMGNTVEAIPVVRRPLEFRTVESVCSSWPEKVSKFIAADFDRARLPSSPLLAKIGWGYRAPPLPSHES